jgi:DNA gyrase/topoisomerase IV subunit B
MVCRSARYDAETIRNRLRELAFLNSRASIHLRMFKGQLPRATIVTIVNVGSFQWERVNSG